MNQMIISFVTSHKIISKILIMVNLMFKLQRSETLSFLFIFEFISNTLVPST